MNAIESSKLNANMWNFYNTVLHRHPIPTEMATSAVLWFSGDLLAQYLEKRYLANKNGMKKIEAVGDAASKQHRQKLQKHIQPQKHEESKLDWRRVGIQTLYAGAIWAPFGHYW